MKKLVPHLVLGLGLAVSAQAATLTFTLQDHGFGALGPDYGLRADQLTPPAGSGPTFSLEKPGAGAVLVWDDVAGTAVISGTIHNNTDGTIWDLSYTLTGLSAAPNGGFFASAGAGSIDEQGGPGFLALTGEQDNGHVLVFDADGHRIPGDDSTWVGRGWVVGGHTNDFLFRAAPSRRPSLERCRCFSAARRCCGWALAVERRLEAAAVEDHDDIERDRRTWDSPVSLLA